MMVWVGTSYQVSMNLSTNWAGGNNLIGLMQRIHFFRATVKLGAKGGMTFGSGKLKNKNCDCKKLGTVEQDRDFHTLILRCFQSHKLLRSSLRAA